MTEAIRKPVDAEIYAAAWMRHLGFHDARETTYGSDAGVDVIASRAIAQVKFRTVQVGRPELQSFVGAAHAHPDKYRLFFSWKGYSSPAVEYAEQAQIALFSFELSGHYVPQNSYANYLCAVAQGLSPAPTWQAPVSAHAAPTWWTPRRIMQLLVGVVLAALVIFFISHPDAFIRVIVFASFCCLALFGLGYGKPKKGRRRTRRRR
jgi:hypothetical protein